MLHVTEKDNNLATISKCGEQQLVNSTTNHGHTTIFVIFNSIACTGHMWFKQGAERKNSRGRVDASSAAPSAFSHLRPVKEKCYRKVRTITNVCLDA